MKAPRLFGREGLDTGAWFELRVGPLRARIGRCLQLKPKQQDRGVFQLETAENSWFGIWDMGSDRRTLHRIEAGSVGEVTEQLESWLRNTLAETVGALGLELRERGELERVTGERDDGRQWLINWEWDRFGEAHAIEGRTKADLAEARPRRAPFPGGFMKRAVFPAGLVQVVWAENAMGSAVYVVDREWNYDRQLVATTPAGADAVAEALRDVAGKMREVAEEPNQTKAPLLDSDGVPLEVRLARIRKLPRGYCDRCSKPFAKCRCP